MRHDPDLDMAIDPMPLGTTFAEWEQERPKGFLEHATRATSQYDAQYRSMAAELLALRTEVAQLSASLAQVQAISQEMRHEAEECSGEEYGVCVDRVGAWADDLNTAAAHRSKEV